MQDAQIPDAKILRDAEKLPTHQRLVRPAPKLTTHSISGLVGSKQYGGKMPELGRRAWSQATVGKQ
ncbi:MAG: hypothetical protein P1U77_01720 [Rubripirellula sp.]|jgi:hypothetical protein|nr:hypothetical protein [Rubripirellula sp.]